MQIVGHPHGHAPGELRQDAGGIPVRRGHQSGRGNGQHRPVSAAFKAEAKAEAEKKRQAEEKAKAEAKAKVEAEKKKAAEAAAKKAAAEALNNSIANEQERIANAQQSDQASNSFINLVKRAVEDRWHLPANADNGLVAQVRVRLGPSGELLAASITRSSGNPGFDRSATQAVEAAAPFRELQQLDAGLQRRFRDFNLKFTPGDIQ